MAVVEPSRPQDFDLIGAVMVESSVLIQFIGALNQPDAGCAAMAARLTQRDRSLLLPQVPRIRRTSGDYAIDQNRVSDCGLYLATVMPSILRDTAGVSVLSVT